MRGSIVLLLVLLALGLALFVGLAIRAGSRPSVAPHGSGSPAVPATNQQATDLLAPETSHARAKGEGAASASTAAAPEAAPAARAAPVGQPAANGANGTITVTVVDSRGTPVAHAAVYKRPESDPLRPSAVPEDFGRGSVLYTDDSGRVVLADVPWGAWRVIAQTEALAPGLSEAVHVTQEAPAATVQVALSAGGDVVGSLRDITGAPAAAIQLSIHPDPLRGGTWRIVLRQVTTEADGSFAFPRLPAGPYKLYTRAEGESAKRVPEQVVDVTVVDGETTHVEFKDLSGTAVQVTGLVLRNGKPLPRVHVMAMSSDIFDASRTASTETDAAGRFEITLSEAGDYRFSVSQGPGLGISTFRETIPQVPHHEIVLEASTGGVAGRVLSARGAPLPGAHVWATGSGKAGDAGARGGGETTADGSGSFQFPDLPAGTYQLTAQAPAGGSSAFDGPSAPQRVVVEAGGEVRDVELRLTAAGEIAGRVLRGDGKPVVNARIEIRASVLVSSDAAGEFRIGGLRPGPVSLRAVIDRECSPWTEVVVAAEQAARAELVVAPGTIVLFEADDGGAPAPSASVTLGDAGAPTAFVALLKEGKGRVGPVPPGTYPLTVRRNWRDRAGPKAESTVTIQGDPEQVVRVRLP